MLKWNKRKEIGACRVEEEQGLPMEKGDFVAMLIAAWITFLPVAVLGVLFLLFSSGFCKMRWHMMILIMDELDMSCNGIKYWNTQDYLMAEGWN